ncbi:uncharacterized protein HD556DRAFT_1310031 [Suillus plorans]|uniref:Uncharacterized protein n=1 Tax=Suillus plorans TaxID=116603 RepID=A0A9P7AK26_9AGAM|nr:uncharacterized protein HD556DRAFT_1310031 [Suillus plorans]KAG1791147.1 hypothetical protein HD556DRAFT_1310031 [Suillus plorans]
MAMMPITAFWVKVNAMWQGGCRQTFNMCTNTTCHARPPSQTSSGAACTPSVNFMPQGSKQSTGVHKANKDCGNQGKKIPAWLERKHRKVARVKKSRNLHRKMGSDDDEDDDNEIVSFEEIAAARKHINNTYEVQPLSQATGKTIIKVDDPSTVMATLSPTQAIEQTCSHLIYLSDCAPGPSADNSSLPMPGQAPSNSVTDGVTDALDDDFVQPDGSPMPQDIDMQQDVEELFVDDYNFQLDDGLFSGVGHDHAMTPSTQCLLLLRCLMIKMAMRVSKKSLHVTVHV